MITWITPAGSLGIITERVIQDIQVEASSNVGPITFTVIAGNLPRGLRLNADVNFVNPISTCFLQGSPSEVKKFTTSRFVIRADDGVDIEDRTFNLSVDGSDIPQWITKEGFLQVGEGNTFFVLDNSYVEYQLSATDTDLTAGDVLEYYLTPLGGQLPPGLSLSSTGLISGFTDPIFALEYSGFPSGGYDTAPLDVTPLDFVEARSNGFDSFLFDNQTYDYNEPSRVPRRLSRIYNFVVSVTDGIHTVNRLFKIFVVTEEFLQSDNSIVQVDTNVFTSDSSNARRPLWITESNLGRLRANNYVTIFLDVYDPPSLDGSISYFLLPTNYGIYRLISTGEIIKDGTYEISGVFPFFPRANFKTTNESQWETISPETPSVVPPGLELDSNTGEFAGKVPYQAAITRTYNFTMLAVNYPSSLSNATFTLVGDWNSFTVYQKDDAVRFDGLIYISLVANLGRVPPENEAFWLKGVSTSAKQFTVEIIGEIDGAIEWLSPSDLGTIKPNQASQLFVEARSLKYGGRVVYNLTSGRLPTGLAFLPTGLIEGKVRQFSDSTSLGLTRFYDVIGNERNFDITFDGGTTTFDQKFTFEITARDSANVAESTKSFSFTVLTDNVITFANLYVKAFQEKSKRLSWYNFITDATIFNSNEIYRYGDPNFGIQTEIKMLVYAGIESVEAVKYVQAMSRNHNNKRLLFGDLKVAVAKDPVTQQTLYETVYVEIVDSMEKNGQSIRSTIELANDIESKVLISYDAIKVDSDIPFVSDSDHQRVFPNSIKNMRKRIQNVGERDREFLPLWMRSIQDSGTFETGYVKALVLCYTKPGQSANIVSRIKNKIRTERFDFKLFDFTADRYVIDIINGEIEDKYLAFPQKDILNKLENPSQSVDAVFTVTSSSFGSDLTFFDSDFITFDQE
jgi:hypothetical protein